MVEIWETPSSGDFRIGDNTTEFVNKYAARGSENRLAILAAIIADTDTVPTEIQGYPRVDISAKVIDGHTDNWDIEVLYSINPGSTLSPTTVGDEIISFSTGGGSTKLKHALQHIQDYAPEGQEVRNHGGAINVTKDGGPEGVDIIVPSYTMRVEKLFDSVDISQTFVRNLFEATGAVNSDSFKGFQAGELLLTRVDGDPRSEDTFLISYEFLGSENVQSLDLGTITGIVKEGHDYLWTEHETTIVGSGEGAQSVQRLIGAHVERVYPRVPYATKTGLSA